MIQTLQPIVLEPVNARLDIITQILAAHSIAKFDQLNVLPVLEVRQMIAYDVALTLFSSLILQNTVDRHDHKIISRRKIKRDRNVLRIEKPVTV